MAEPRRIDAPIIIFSFDRPAYLDRFCTSLKAQRGVSFEDTQIHLVQDGPVSRRTGVRYGEDAAMAESVAVFRRIFPGGQIHASADNLGIAFNIQRGEKLAFEMLDADIAYFFEDDLELGPDYMTMMERLREATAPYPEIGYFAVYGDHRARPDPNRVRIVPLDHHWAFALRRDAWTRINDWLAPYFQVLGKADYATRNHLGVYRWLEGQSMAIDKSSQDAMKALAAAQLGIARVMTDMCFGRYIGEKGASFNEKKFRDLGYDKMEPVENGALPFEPLTQARVDAILANQQAIFRNFREREFDGFLERYSARHFDPERLMTREDVDNLYRLLLDRLPEGEHLYAEYVGGRSVRLLRGIMFNSREFRGRNTGA